jgi:hypothetical protein
MTPPKKPPNRDSPEPVRDPGTFFASTFTCFGIIGGSCGQKTTCLLIDISVWLLNAKDVAKIVAVDEVGMSKTAIACVGSDHLEKVATPVVVYQLLGESADRTQLIGFTSDGALVHTDSGLGRNQMCTVNSGQTIWSLFARPHWLNIGMTPAVQFAQALAINGDNPEGKPRRFEVPSSMLGFHLAVKCLAQLDRLKCE